MGAKAKEIDVAVRLEDQITRQLNFVERSIQKFATGTKASFGLVAGASKLAGIGIGAAVLLKSKDILETIDGVEDIRSRINQLVEDSEAASRVTKKLVEAAAQSQFDSDDLTSAFEAFRNAGLDDADRLALLSARVADTVQRDAESVARAVTNLEVVTLREMGVLLERSKDTATVSYKGITTTVKNENAEIQNAIAQLFEREFPGSFQVGATEVSEKLKRLASQTQDILQRTLAIMGPRLGEQIDRITKFVDKHRETIIAVGQEAIREVGRFSDFFTERILAGVDLSKDLVEVTLAALGIQISGYEAARERIEKTSTSTLERIKQIAIDGANFLVSLGPAAFNLGELILRVLLRTLENGARFAFDLVAAGFRVFGAAVGGGIESGLNLAIPTINRFIERLNKMLARFGVDIPLISKFEGISKRLENAAADSAEQFDRTLRKINENVKANAADYEKFTSKLPQQIDDIRDSLDKFSEVTGVRSVLNELAALGERIHTTTERLKSARAALNERTPLPGVPSGARGGKKEGDLGPDSIAAAIVSGIQEGLEAWKDGLKKLEESAKNTVANIRTTFVDGLADGLTGSIDNINSLGEAFDNIVDSILLSIQRLAIEAASSALFDLLLSPIISGIVGGIPGLGGSNTPSAGGSLPSTDLTLRNPLNTQFGGPRATSIRQGDTIINMNVNARDAKSFDQDLIERRNLIVGIVADARASSPAVRQELAA